MHRVSEWALRDRELAATSVLLFCLSPASPFFSTAYTESVFVAASTAGMYLLYCHGAWWAAAAVFAAAGAARSNGARAALMECRNVHQMSSTQCDGNAVAVDWSS